MVRALEGRVKRSMSTWECKQNGMGEERGLGSGNAASEHECMSNERGATSL